MRDMREGWNKAITNYEDGESYKLQEEVRLSDRDKEMIEYGYIQCSLQIGYDIVSKGESFMIGLQEMVLENEALKVTDRNNKIYSICEKVLTVSEDEIKEIDEICQKQINYISPLKMKTMRKQRKLGEYNKKILDKIIDLKKLLENKN